MEINEFRLANGIRLVHHPVNGNVSHCGIFINAGSRDEKEKEHGLAHFIEHVIFKGTAKRNVFQVLNRLENVGADLNAYTSKEDTCIYASFLNPYYDRTLELLSDILFHSTFPLKELEKEKTVISEEIKSYLDTPSDQIFDDFEDLVFSGHPLGKNILGTEKSLKKLNRNDVLDFVRRNYRTEEMVIVSVGKILFSRLVKIVSKYFDARVEPGIAAARNSFTSYHPGQKIVKKKIFQVHCIIGGPGYAYGDDRRIPLALLNNMLGGPVLNSRLSLALRERNGLTYHNESAYTPYSDSGIVSIYFGTDPVHYDKALHIIHKELEKLRSRLLTKIQLHTIKNQLIGQISIAQESHLGLMFAIGKNYLVMNRYDPVETVISRINLTPAEELLEIARDVFNPGQLSMLTFQSR